MAKCGGFQVNSEDLLYHPKAKQAESWEKALPGQSCDASEPVREYPFLPSDCPSCGHSRPSASFRKRSNHWLITEHGKDESESGEKQIAKGDSPSLVIKQDDSLDQIIEKQIEKAKREFAEIEKQIESRPKLLQQKQEQFSRLEQEIESWDEKGKEIESRKQALSEQIGKLAKQREILAKAS